VRAEERTVVIGLAADSGCGKSTFMRRMTSVFGGTPSPPEGEFSEGGGWVGAGEKRKKRKARFPHTHARGWRWPGAHPYPLAATSSTCASLTAHSLSHPPSSPKIKTGGNPDSNTLLSDMTTVICLDDYHLHDRNGRKVAKVTALDEKAQNFDLMYEQVKALREGKAVDKPIYNHVSGLLDPAERIEAPKILVIEGLHPFWDKRVRDLLDLKIYLDISDEIKFAWKVQRDMAERGHSLESIKASIESRKPDFDAYVDPQKQYADIIIQVLPTQLIPDEKEGKVLRVRMIQKYGKELFTPAHLFDEGSTVSWIPCGRKLTCSFPGIKFYYGPDVYMGEEVSVLEMDGQFDNLEELIYVESHLSNTSAKFYGEITQQMLKNATFPGSNNGTGLFQTICGLKIRETYEKIVQKEVASVV
jgi:phosphoribulokinase